MGFQYQRLMEQLISLMDSQKIVAHQQLPSIRELSTQYDVSLNTVKRCYSVLEAKGYVYAIYKSGYYAAARKCADYPQLNPTAVTISRLDLLNEIHAAAAHKEHVPLGSVQLSPALFPIEAIRRSLKRSATYLKPENFLLAPKEGEPQLQQALSEHLAEDGIYSAARDIIITNGCTAALSAAISALSGMADSIAVPVPAFNGHLQLLANMGRKVIEIPSNEYGIDLASLEEVMQLGIAKACVLTANYQNPLAYCLSDEDKQKVAELAARYQFPIIEDDVYGECGFLPKRPLPIKSWDTQGYVIWCGSTSKTLSRNFRVGWCVGGEGIAGFRAKFIALNSTVNTPLQLYLADFIYSRAYRAYLSRLGSKLRQQVHQYREKVLVIFADKCKSITQPQGGYWLWIELPPGNDSVLLYQQAMQQQINIVPGVVFGEQQDFSRYIRINAGVPLNPVIEQALQQLADLISV